MAFLAAAATGKIPANAPAGKVYTFLLYKELNNLYQLISQYYTYFIINLHFFRSKGVKKGS